jgi:hypothetical protein
MTIILAIGLIVLALLAPTFFCAGFYFGFNTAEGVFCQQAVSVENIPGSKIVDKVKDSLHKETEEERLARLLAENVENFGTNVPQKEVV